MYHVRERQSARRQAGNTCVWLMGYSESVKMAEILCVSSKSSLANGI
jgi:hypothetical protein